MIFCNMTDCHNWEDEVCESCENITIGDDCKCQNYVPVNPEDFEEIASYSSSTGILKARSVFRIKRGKYNE